ncbi:hypothetical protein LSAT2_014872 [Lamellibrachia satsuma]|nr:hypothetical protein LSAT2_014872 [Lamellibrachia satsuma]
MAWCTNTRNKVREIPESPTAGRRKFQSSWEGQGEDLCQRLFEFDIYFHNSCLSALQVAAQRQGRSTRQNHPTEEFYNIQLCAVTSQRHEM